ncbi:MAG: hypothetical protein Q7J85_08085 [Bacillota bacterium]|nr:hypothetical protein [Bacillota bacterium]
MWEWTAARGINCPAKGARLPGFKVAGAEKGDAKKLLAGINQRILVLKGESGHMAIYLDNSATTFLKSDTVYQAVDSYLRRIGVSSGRGVYRQTLEDDGLIYQARKMLGRLFNVNDVTQK